MATSDKPASKTRIILTWVAMVGWMVAIMTYFFWRNQNATPKVDDSGPVHSVVVNSVFSLFVGVFFLVLGVASYLVTVFTGCFTFDYNRPVWVAAKTRQFIANIIVPVGLGLGFGFIVSAFFSPFLRSIGLDESMANMAPLFFALMVFQILQLWILIWAPAERQFIRKRLATFGITSAHLQGATLIGLSSPDSGLAKRFAAIEEDMGALWITPEALMFRCDVEQFDLTREQILEVERRADKRSTTMLAGIAHIILYVQLTEGGVRQIRLHVEGLWTMGQKKRTMDNLAQNILQWHSQRSA